VTVAVGVKVGVGESEEVRDGVCVGVDESDEPVDGVCVLLLELDGVCDEETVAEHEGAAARPAVVHASGHGHAVGAPAPAGQ